MIVYHPPRKTNNEIAQRCTLYWLGGERQIAWAMQNVVVLGDIFRSLIAFETKERGIDAL